MLACELSPLHLLACWLLSLDITLVLENGELVFRDRATGAVLLTPAEAAEARAAELEAARKEAEADSAKHKAARARAEKRAAQLEAELLRLRTKSKKKANGI
jgi:hypothetical protein